MRARCIGYTPTAIGYTPTAIGYPPTAIGYPPTAIGYPPTAIGYTPTAIGYTPTAIGYPPTAISYPPDAIIGRIGHSEFFFLLWQPLVSMGAIQRGTSWATIPKTLNRARTVHAPCAHRATTPPQSEHTSPGSPDTGWGAYSFCCSIPLVYHLQKRAASWSADIDTPNSCSPHAQARVHAAVFKRRIPFQGLCS